ncbi:MAG: PQQ-binding-like beta-propeller repeat protein, partial [Euryarchaeota archaeon]|nr:PQQ-binding-like beta-propeller repeat protein [Euryarchaeota archaeon]
PTGLSGNNLNDGDLLQFCYGYSNWTTGVSPTPDNFENIVNITVNISGEPGPGPGPVPPGPGPSTANMRWNTTLSGDVSTPPVVSDGKIFVSTWWETVKVPEYYLYCINSGDGTILWSNSLADNVGSYLASAALGEDKVFVRGTDGVLYAIYTDNGTTAWTQTIDNSPLWWSEATSSPVVYEDHLFIMSQKTGILRDFDFNGNEKRNFDTNGCLHYRSSPVISDGSIYTAGNNSAELFCIDFETFEQSWKFTSPESIVSSPVIGTDEIYITTASKLYAINKLTGLEEWNTTINSRDGVGTPSLSDGYLYVGENDGLSRYNAADGTKLWTYASASVTVSPEAANGTVYFATNEKSGKVIALYSDNSTLMWQYEQTGPASGYDAGFWGSSPYTKDGMLFIGGSYYNTLYCFGPDLSVGVPVLHASPQGAVTPATVEFSASGGQHGKQYTLDFGDGSAPHTSGTVAGVATSHTYTNPAEYTATLAVSNDADTRQTSLTITVLEAPGNITADETISANVGGTNVTTTDDGKQRIRINTSEVQGNITSDGNTTTIDKPDGTTLTIVTDNTTSSGGVISGDVSSVVITSPTITGGEISTDVGNASVDLSFTMSDYQDNSSVQTEISANVTDDARNAFTVACTDSGESISLKEIAYTVYFTKSGFTNESKISAVQLNFTVKTSWITSIGGIGNVKIIRWKDDGTKLVLTPVSSVESGDYTILTIKTDGFSVYGIVSVQHTPSGGGGGSDDSITYTPVTLSGGTFNVTAENSGKTYIVNRNTALGILDQSGTSYSISDSYYLEYGSLFLTSVKGIPNEGLSGWVYQVNGITPGTGTNNYALNAGDKVVYYWSDSMDASPESSSNIIALRAVITGNSDASSGTDNNTVINPETGETDIIETHVLSIPKGASITLSEYGESFTIDLNVAKAAGESVKMDGNDVVIKRHDIELRVHLKDFTDKKSVISGIIDYIYLKTGTISNEIPDIGTISASFDARLNSFPVDAEIKTTIQSILPENIQDAFLLTSPKDGYHISNIAYAMTIKTGHLKDGTDIGTATIRMSTDPAWVKENGGEQGIVIMHRMDDGTVEALETAYTGTDSTGNMVFEAVSPKGLSTFAIVAITEGQIRSADQTKINTSGTDNIPETGPVQSGLPVSLIVVAVIAAMFIGGSIFRRKMNEK